MYSAICHTAARCVFLECTWEHALSYRSSAASQGDRLVLGRCSYTAQTAWIQNASVRENILMGRAFDAALYAAVIDACALQPDLDLLAAGGLAKKFRDAEFLEHQCISNCVNMTLVTREKPAGLNQDSVPIRTHSVYLCP